MKPTLHQIETTVERVFDVTPGSLFVGRLRHVAEARFTFWRLAMDNTRLSKGALAERYGYERTTLIHAAKRFADLVNCDEDYKERTSRAKSLLTKSK